MPASSPKPKAIAIMGPTAAGKTDLSLALAEHFKTEIISVDSALIYKGMDIGTAKPSVEEQIRVRHHLIDIRDPSEAYSAAEFVRDAKAQIERLVSEGKTPILVGGTMLYFKALLEGLSPMPASDPAIRAEVEAKAAKLGWPAMHAELMALDPKTATALHPNHSQRIGRALEVYLASGKPMSQFKDIPGDGLLSKYDWVQLAIAPTTRSILHQRIAERFKHMLEYGFLTEVERLIRRGDLHSELPAIRAVGYRQVWQYLSGELEYDQMIDAGIAATRQLAKRQLTWLRSWHGLSWINSTMECGQARSLEQIFTEAVNNIGNTTV